jgi:4-amino-4-deoxy-L-arabinose transferase-like glycosyltransferase
MYFANRPLSSPTAEALEAAARRPASWPARASPLLWAAAAFALALALRLAWVLSVDTQPAVSDPQLYHVLAVNLAEGRGYVMLRAEGDHFLAGEGGQPTAWAPPGYPMALATVYKLFGASADSAKVFNAVAGALAVAFTYGVGRLAFGHRAGALGALLFVFFPSHIVWSSSVLSESLFSLLLVASLWVLLALRPAAGQPDASTAGGWGAALRPFGRAQGAALFGVLVALATLTRGQGAVLLPLGAVFWLWRDGWRPALRQGLAALVVMAALMMPWFVRNLLAMDAPIPVSSNVGIVLRTGHHPDSEGHGFIPLDRIDGWETMTQTEQEVIPGRIVARRAVTYAVRHPLREVELAGRKLYWLFRDDDDGLPWATNQGETPIRPSSLEDVLPHVMNGYYYAILLASGVSMALWLALGQRGAVGGLLVLVVAAWALMHVITFGEPRYHVALLPVLCLWSAYLISAPLRSRVRQRA